MWTGRGDVWSLTESARASYRMSSGAFRSGALPLTDAVDLHLYLDGSVLELVADGRLALSTRLYPSREDSLEVHLFSRGGGQQARFLGGVGAGPDLVVGCGGVLSGSL